jgi:DNA-binding XRE family transcriptional regulator
LHPFLVLGPPFRAPVPWFCVTVGRSGASVLPLLHSVPRFLLDVDTAGHSVVPVGHTVDIVGHTIDTARHSVDTVTPTVANTGDKVVTVRHNGDTRTPSGDTRGPSVHRRRQNREARMTQRARKLVDALLEWRARDRKSQVDAAKMLSVARKTYLFLEAGSWLPPVREQHFFAHTLASVDPQLGEAFARACGTTGEALGLAKPAPAPLLTAVQARTTYDAAIYSAAEEADVPAKAARILVAAVIAKLCDAGVTMGQAEDCGRRASSARP